MRKLAAAVLVMLTVAVPAYGLAADGEITLDDLEQAAAVRRRVAAELSEATALYEENVTLAEELDDKLTSLSITLAIQERDLTGARIAARDIARELYMAAESSRVGVLFDSRSLSEVPVRQGYMQLVSSADAATLNHLEALEVTYLDQQNPPG